MSQSIVALPDVAPSAPWSAHTEAHVLAATLKKRGEHFRAAYDALDAAYERGRKDQREGVA